MAEAPDKGSQADTLNKECQLGGQPVALNSRFSRMPAVVLSLSALILIGAGAGYGLLNSSFAELFPGEAASAPIPDPSVSAALKDIQSFQKQNEAALQENRAVLQQNAAMLHQGADNLESFRQSFTAQQTDLKRISNQLSSLLARVDFLQNAVMPLTTSSIPQPNVRTRVARTLRKKTSRLPTPAGPVSVGGAPLNRAPAPGWGAG